MEAKSIGPRKPKSWPRLTPTNVYAVNDATTPVVITSACGPAAPCQLVLGGGGGALVVHGVPGR
jgi:hypothetical protein